MIAATPLWSLKSGFASSALKFLKCFARFHGALQSLQASRLLGDSKGDGPDGQASHACSSDYNSEQLPWSFSGHSKDCPMGPCSGLCWILAGSVP